MKVLKRNSGETRFSESFCFQLAEDEYADLVADCDLKHKNTSLKGRTQVFAICLYRAENNLMLSAGLKEVTEANEVSVKIINAF